MLWIWIVLGIILYLLFIKISVTITGAYSELTKSFVVEVAIFAKLIKKTFVIYPPAKAKPEEDKDEEKSEASQGEFNFIKNFRQIHTMIKKLLKHISIDSFTWRTWLGLGEAMETGVATGAAWALKGWLLGFLSGYFTIEDNVELDVQPVFNGTGIRSELDSTISFRLIVIVLSALPLFMYWRQMKKGELNNNGSSN